MERVSAAVRSHRISAVFVLLGALLMLGSLGMSAGAHTVGFHHDRDRDEAREDADHRPILCRSHGGLLIVVGIWHRHFEHRLVRHHRSS